MPSSMRSLFTTLRLSLRTAAQPADSEPPASVPLRSLAVSLALLAAALPLAAQVPNRITAAIDPAQTHTLLHHRPAWASAANDRGPVAPSLKLDSMTLVLARSPQQQAALTQLLADQQNPASPQYHQWLTPTEMGLRFGLSDDDIATLTGWLQSQGLHVNWVAPNRIFLGFGGTAADVNRAFQTELHTYSVNGESRYSVNSDPVIPAALAPAILAIRGLSTPSERPDSHVSVRQSASPQMTVTNNSVTSHFITPADFATIYDVPTTYTGSGVTIGIVGWSRVDTNDLNEFRSRTGTSFPNPNQVVSTYGGIDPGSPCTTTSCSSSALSSQEEATLDVTRAGSVAPGANLELVVSTSSGTQDGIGADAQYLVDTTPVVQVMSISFGDCEIDGGSSEVTYWNNLFQTAAGEGISVFVSSGDSGAAGCDTPFVAPPSASKQLANSPNAICSSSYATCVGGTEFNDSSSPSSYWGSTNSSTLESAYGYIPEGGWNESTSSSVAASGGGVSTYITPTPSWQTGTGVPSARAGRYTPDVAFSAASHDGYFACMESESASCAGTTSFGFLVFYGTSAAAPSMAGITALLDQKLGGAQGNLNPELYALAASVPSAFHDATVSTSGVGSCNLSAISTCNNTVPTASGTQAGYQLQTGYDEVTGLGSLDVAAFLADYSSTGSTPSPTFTVSGTTPSAISSPGGTATSTITVTSEYGFSGSIVLSGTIGQYPSGAALAYVPTFTFSPSSTVSLSSGGTQQVTVTIHTTAAGAAALHRPSLPWYGEGGAALACLLFFGLPARRRRWLSVLGLALLFVAITSGVSACSGGGSGSGGGGTTIVGTTPGTYTFLVTGSSGSTTVISSQITLTVN